MSTIRFTDTHQISLICIHTYIHMHMRTSGRWWQRAVMAYFVPNIQIGPVLDEDLHHLQMTIISGGHERSPSLLSETDTHSERNTTACHHTLPPLSIYKHTYIQSYIHTVCIFKDSCASICYCIHTYIHTVWTSTHTAHTERHRSYIQATNYTWTYIETDKHPD